MTDDLEVVQKGTLNKMLAMQIRIEKLEAANLKQSCIKVDDEARIEKLEAALDDALQYVSRADWHYLKDETRKVLEGKDG